MLRCIVGIYCLKVLGACICLKWTMVGQSLNYIARDILPINEKFNKKDTLNSHGIPFFKIRC
jgi:hypothetical protein